MAIRLHTDFKDFLRLLNSHKVEYLLIGGYAVGFHGYPRATADMDIWIAISNDNAAKTVNVLQKFGFDVPELSMELFLQQNKIIRLGNAPIRIEILTTISGVQFEECFRHKVKALIDGIKVNVINLEDLKKNKKACARVKDMDDIKKLP
jgi:predicted nucleotidyltransferase